MGIFGWSLPPGCTNADIDRAAGVTAEAEAREDLEDNIWGRLDSKVDRGSIEAICDYVWLKMGESYKLGYDQGQADAHLALSQSQE